MSDRFQTIDATPGRGVDVELEIKRSRFLTRLYRVETEAAARDVIDERRSTHFDARHHCSAFVLGPDGRTARSSDDGEPAGTAGVPILQVLQKSHLTDVVAVVTRYFGGVKLGAGGLVRAYSDATAQAVVSAGLRTVRLCTELQIDVDFSEAGSVEGQLRGLVLPSGVPVHVSSTEWTDVAHLRVLVPADAENELHIALASLTGGTLDAVAVAERWVG